MFNKYDAETLERAWQIFLKRYKQVLRELGEHDFEVEHTGTRKRQREGALLMSVQVGQEAHTTALN